MIVEVTLLGVFKEAFGSEHTSLTVEPSRRLREIITRLTESSQFWKGWRPRSKRATESFLYL